MILCLSYSNRFMNPLTGDAHIQYPEFHHILGFNRIFINHSDSNKYFQLLFWKTLTKTDFKTIRMILK